MTKFEQFAEVYRRHLLDKVAKRSKAYSLWVEGKTDEEAREHANGVATSMLNAVKNRGIRGINIDSPALKAAAKELGINNTYQNWEAWLTEEQEKQNGETAEQRNADRDVP